MLSTFRAISPLGNLDLTPYGFMLTALFLAWGLGREGILEAMPVSRSTVVQELGDGLLVLDPRGRRGSERSPRAASSASRTPSCKICR